MPEAGVPAGQALELDGRPALKPWSSSFPKTDSIATTSVQRSSGRVEDWAASTADRMKLSLIHI
eukprot:6376187-Alexandrium_andersonii.AAC.1